MARIPLSGLLHVRVPSVLTPGAVVLLYLEADTDSPDYLDIRWTDGDTVATVESRAEIPGLGNPADHTIELTTDKAGRSVSRDRFRYYVPLDQMRATFVTSFRQG
jgi:hypothetical protein